MRMLSIFGIMAAMLFTSAVAFATDSPPGFNERDYIQLIPADAVHVASAPASLPDITQSERTEICFDQNREHATVTFGVYRVTVDIFKTKLNVPKNPDSMDPGLLQALSTVARLHANPARAEIVDPDKPGTNTASNLSRSFYVSASAPTPDTRPFDHGPYPVNSAVICHTNG